MTSRNLLTIGLPTFNRRDSVSKIVEALLAARAYDIANILVIDDGSDDQTFDVLSTLVADAPVRLSRNSNNLGYAANFIRLFDECDTEYLLLSTDDDPVVHGNLRALIRLLESRGPLLVSTQFYVAGELYRGKKEITEIQAADFLECSTHAPGLVYRVDAARASIPLIKGRIQRQCAAALVYPQVLLTCDLLAHGLCLWWDKPIVSLGEQRQSGVTDSTRERYYFVASRWRQQLGFLEFLGEQCERLAGSTEEHVRAVVMLRRAEVNLFATLRFGILKERPDLLGAFDDGAIRFARSSLFSRRLGRLLSHPLTTSRAVRARLTRGRTTIDGGS